MDRRIQSDTKQYYSVKPYIDPITTHALQAGDDATLICIAQGQPRPELTWTFKNKTIGKTVNYTLLPFYLEINDTIIYSFSYSLYDMHYAFR